MSKTKNKSFSTSLRSLICGLLILLKILKGKEKSSLVVSIFSKFLESFFIKEIKSHWFFVTFSKKSLFESMDKILNLIFSVFDISLNISPAIPTRLLFITCVIGNLLYLLQIVKLLFCFKKLFSS